VIGEIVRFVRDGHKKSGVVYCYMPNGGPEMNEPYVKVKDTRPYMVSGVVKHFDTYVVSLADESFEVVTLDRELGSKYQGANYASKTEDPKRGN